METRKVLDEQILPEQSGQRDVNVPITVLCYILSLSGGAGTNMARLAAGMTRHGYRVVLVYSHSWEKCRDQVRNISGVQEVSLRSERNAQAVLPVSRLIREYRPTVLFTTVGNNGAVVLLAKKLAGSNARVVVREANSPSELLKKHGRIERKLRIRVLTWVYRRAYRVIAITDQMAEEIRLKFGVDSESIVMIHNGIPLPRQVQSIVPKIESVGSQSLPVILSVGRLVPQKGHADLLKAIASFSQRLRSRCVILGDGPERAKLSELASTLGISSLVTFAGHVDDPSSYYAAADVFVLASRFEGFPSVIVEALSFGVPVVATNCPTGPSEIICDDRYGFLVPVGDSIALGKAIETAIARQFDEDDLRARARMFSVEKQISVFNSLIEEAVCAVKRH